MSTTTTTTAPAANEDTGCQNAAKETVGFKMDYKMIQFGEYKDVMMTYYQEPLEVHVPKVKNMTLPDTDIILLTYPKSERGHLLPSPPPKPPLPSPSPDVGPAIMSTSTTDDVPPQEDAAKESKRFKVDPKLMKLGQYNGMLMPQYIDPPEVHVPKVMNLFIRDTDIVLLTYPKSGTHWVWRVLDMLATGSATYSDRYPDNFFLDLVPTEVVDEAGEDVRRVLNTHYPSDLLPAQLKDGRVKVVHVYRHPKAMMTSLLFQMQTVGHIPDITMDKLEAMSLAGKGVFKNQFYYFDKMKEYERDNPNVDIFHLAYEDMKKDTVGCIKKLAAHLNVNASDDLCSSIAEAVSFNTQKKNEESGDEMQKNMKFYRKGEVDDWKNHMTVAQSERINKVVADRAASCQFCRRYCPTITTDQGDVYRLESSS